MLDGREPSPPRVRALESYLISTIEHGFNASTFTARVVASTGADLGSAVIAALGSLSGPLHGGAPARVLDMLDSIGTPDRADRWIRDRLARGEVVMGFGHAVYRTADPRSTMLRTVAEELDSSRLELAASSAGRRISLSRPGTTRSSGRARAMSACAGQHVTTPITGSPRERDIGPRLNGSTRSGLREHIQGSVVA